MIAPAIIYGVRVLLLAGLYFVAGKLGLLVALDHENVSPVWPAAGLALGALLLGGWRLWPGIFLGAFLVALTTNLGLLGAGLIAAGNTLAAVVGAWLLRWVDFRPSFERLGDVGRLVLLAGLLSTSISASVGICAVMLADGATPSVAQLWWTWWLGDAVGILVVAPVLLTWGTRGLAGLSSRALLEAALLLGVVLVAGSLLLFALPAGVDIADSLAFAVFAVVLWAAVRFGPRGAATASLLVAALALCYATAGVGPFQDGSLRERLVTLHAFLVMLTVTALAVAAALAERRLAERTRTKFELQFRRLWEKSADGMWLLDAQGKVLRVNEAFCRMVHKSEAELVGQPFTVVYVESQQASAMRRFQEGQLPSCFERELTLWDGTRIWVEYSNTLLEEEGEAPLIMSICKDVTERKLAEESLRKSEERYRSLFEANPQPMYVFDWETLRFLAVNAATVAKYGWSRDEFMKMTILDIRRPEDVPELLQHFHDGAPVIGHAGVRKHRQKDGTIFDAEIIAHDIYYGKRRARFAMINDVTERVRVEESLRIEIASRKQAEEAIRASEAKYRSLVENLEQQVFLKDADMCFVAANQPFCQSVGHSEAAIVGRTDLQIYPRRLAEKYRIADLQVLEQGQRFETEEQTLIDGNPRTVRTVKTPVKDDQGKIVGVLGIRWDVTEQRALEAHLRQTQKMEAVGQLAGGVAHDFNNLLTAILGNLSLVVAGSQLSDNDRELLLAAEKAGQRAAELTRQLLGFSRRMPLRPQPLNFQSVIDETVAIMRRTFDPRITLEVEVASDLWHVLADPGQMTQVLMNLCLNARDAMPQGGRLQIVADNWMLGDQENPPPLPAVADEVVRIQVSDSGVGIAPEHLSKIFEPFFTTKEPGKGTGLGLAMVFGIIQQHKGWIECHSDLGRGTRFDIYLPRSLEAPAAAEQVESDTSVAGHETILLVDDELMIRNLGRTILTKQGYQVLLAENGREAAAIFRRDRDHIDLVLLDLTMPEMSGRETMKQLRQIDPAARVLYMSGYSSDQLSESSLAGALGFLNKPFSPKQLAQTVRKTLDLIKVMAQP